MDLMGLQTFLLLGLPLLALAVSREFHFVDLMKTWTEAQSYCRENFSDLATLESAEDWAKVKGMVINSGHVRAWIGLYNDVKSWRWSLDNTSLFQEELGSWFVFTEENRPTGEHCADLNQGKIYDYNCENELRSVCYDETSNTYIEVTDVKSWQSAQSYCRQAYTDLASIRNQQELNNVMAVVDSSQLYWIGLYRDSWKWSDQSNSSFRSWASGEPSARDQNCVVANVGAFYDASCTTAIPFICSAPQKKVLKVMLNTDGSVNLADPLVQETILKQMEKDLKSHGVHEELSLRWRKQPHGHVFNKTDV